MRLVLKPENAESIYQVGNIVRTFDCKTLLVCCREDEDRYFLVELRTGNSVGSPWYTLKGLAEDCYRSGDRVIANPTLVEEGAEG